MQGVAGPSREQWMRRAWEGTKVGYPREGTRQTVCERLNDVWVRGRWPLTDYIGIHRHFTYNGSYGFCQNQFVPR